MSGWPRNWQAAIQRVLEGVLKLPEATIFAEPVPLDETPGYRELISNPMDLGTILGRAKADAYDTPLEALADVRQVCILFLPIVIVDITYMFWQTCQMAEVLLLQIVKHFCTSHKLFLHAELWQGCISMYDAKGIKTSKL